MPALTTRRAETTVELGSGQGFALAGLLQRGGDDDVRKFPFLGDLPVLGPLFRSKRYARRETELVIIVTPSLVQPVAGGGAGRCRPPTAGCPAPPSPPMPPPALPTRATPPTPPPLAPPIGDEALAGARRLREGKPLPLPDSSTGAATSTPTETDMSAPIPDQRRRQRWRSGAWRSTGDADSAGRHRRGLCRVRLAAGRGCWTAILNALVAAIGRGQPPALVIVDIDRFDDPAAATGAAVRAYCCPRRGCWRWAPQ